MSFPKASGMSHSRWMLASAKVRGWKQSLWGGPREQRRALTQPLYAVTPASQFHHARARQSIRLTPAARPVPGPFCHRSIAAAQHNGADAYAVHAGDHTAV
jgi:hypothetical protein